MTKFLRQFYHFSTFVSIPFTDNCGRTLNFWKACTIALEYSSGVSYGSIKRFEMTGKISLLSLTKIAMALDIADELRGIFTNVPYKDIQEVINETR